MMWIRGLYPDRLQKTTIAPPAPEAIARALILIGLVLVATACDSGPQPQTAVSGELTQSSDMGSSATAGSESGPAPGASPGASVSDPPDVFQPDAPLVDPAQEPSVAGEGGWNHFLAGTADLDGDGQDERVVVMARVELYQGRPAWDDGQPWQAYVEEADGSRTYIYARFVQLGTVTMRIGLAEGADPATVILLEHLPDRLAVYEVAYRGPERTELVHLYERMADPRGELASPTLP